jgi:hypothetical protein
VRDNPRQPGSTNRSGDTDVNANPDRYELTIGRGLLAGLVAGALGFALPWTLLYLLYVLNWLGADLDPSREGAWVGSYFTASLFGTGAFVSFVTRPKSHVGRNTAVIGLVAIVILTLTGFIGGPRYKSDPPFGEAPLDLVLLTAPAVATGVVLLAYHTLRASRTRRLTVDPPTGQP